jgi:hypothetical protein
MEVIKPGTDDLKEMASIGCCWPPGTETMEYPEAD